MNLCYLFYTTFIVGVILTQSAIVSNLFTIIKSRTLIRRNLKSHSVKIPYRGNNAIILHIMKLIATAPFGKMIGGIKEFFILSGIIFITILLGIRTFIPMYEAILYSFFAGLIPYIILQMQMGSVRTKGSKEGDILIPELLNNYKIYGYNMKEAIDKTVLSLDNAPVAKAGLITLAKRINNYSDKEDIAEAIEVFKFSFNTVWCRMLASNIGLALVEGIRVDKSLEDLLRTVRNGRKIMEANRRGNYEANIITKFLVPISYILSVFAGIKYFNLTPEKFIQLQFGTLTGIRWFSIMVLCYVISLFLIKYLTEDKMDV